MSLLDCLLCLDLSITKFHSEGIYNVMLVLAKVP